MPEQQNIEYKQSWHDDYLKWVFGLTLEELKGEHNSRPRNPKIAKACFMAGYIDAWGRGTLKIYNSCKEHGLPEPTISEKEGGFMVALHKVGQSNDEGGLVDGLVNGLVESQQKIVRLIEKNPEISIKEMAEHVGVSTTAIDKNIATLKEKNIIRRVGEAKHGSWEIIKLKND